MHEISFEEAIELILKRDPRYQPDAYHFIREALDFTQKTIGKGSGGRHVSGQELVEGIRAFALEKYGPMAITVFDSWGVHTCQDFGELVFNLVEIGVLAKTDKDSRADFGGGYDFGEAFRKPFLPPSKQAQFETAPASSHPS